MIFQGIQSVVLPMVQEFGYTREIEDRVLAPMPVSLVVLEKVTAGALYGAVSAALVFPIATIVPATPVHLDISWWVLLTLTPLACFMCGALGLCSPHVLRAADGADVVRHRGAAAHDARLHLLPCARRPAVPRPHKSPF